MIRPVESAHQYIRERILSGHYQPGHPLATKHLATEIGVSRTPIRDALRQLETEGLVEINPRQEARVKNANYDELRNIWELRIALETHAATLAVSRHNEEDVERLEQTLKTMRSLINEIDTTKEQELKWKLYQQLAQADIRFHLTILDAARNQLIKDEVLRFRVIHSVLLPNSNLSLEDRTIKSYDENLEIWLSHKQIFDALRRRDEMNTLLAMKEHLTTPMQRRLSLLRSEMEVQSMQMPDIA